MSANETEPILIDLEEKIVFRQGEEIDDLYGISIQPDINVFKEATHIHLRGVLIVSGEYQSIPNDEPVYLVDEDQQENYVQQVKALDNGFTTFQYPIPVDITIPYNRISQADEPIVDIEYFDYELPEPRTLNVFAKIRLDGVQLTDQYEEERYEYNPDFELKAVPEFNEPFNDEQSRQYDSFETNIQSFDDEEENEEERLFWKKEKTQSLSDFFKKDQAKAEDIEVTETVDDLEEETQEVHQELDDNEAVDVMAEQSTSDEESQEDKPKKKKKGLSYLSSLFRDEESGEDRAQLKMRFVQTDETLESIANEYDVSVTRLEVINGLEDGYELEPGQVLYVPIKKKTTS